MTNMVIVIVKMRAGDKKAEHKTSTYQSPSPILMMTITMTITIIVIIWALKSRQ